MPDVVRHYKSSAAGDDKIDKRFDYKCTQPDAYEDESKNSFVNIFTDNDRLNKIYNDQWDKKTEGLIAENSFAGIISKANALKDKIETAALQAVKSAKESFNSATSAVTSAAKNSFSVVSSVATNSYSSVKNVASAAKNTFSSTPSTV